MLFGIGNLWADGSKDLYPSGAQGGRAYLRASTTESAAFPFPNLGAHYVYAEAGERIALASSAQSGSVKRIYLYNPSGQDVTPTISSGVGNIPNRSAELAGPRLPNQNAGGDRYAPIYYTVPAGGDGIYKVEFRGTSSSTTGDTRMNYVAANTNWTQANNSNYLAAWDISVAKQTGGSWNWQRGRVYTTVLNMDNPSFTSAGTTFRSNSGFYGKFKVLTRDGYVYNVDNNGNQGISFTFMVNNRGFHVVGNPNTPSYQSIAASTANDVKNRYHDPRTADGEAAVTQKIFYTLPDGNMPEYAIGGPVNNAETWLRIPQKSLDVSNLEVVGAEGSSQQLGSKGAYIKFTNESGGDYYITIKPKEGATQTFPLRELSGTSIIGDNEIYWDGKDGQGNPLPPGISEVEVDLKLRGAEVHFPYIDMELNHFGIILELLTEDLQGVVSDKVYWDDTGIGNGGGNNGTKTAPRNASHAAIPNGTSSNSNGHIWGLNSNATQNTFGDNMGMDTWTFIEGDVLTVDFDVDVKKADFYTKIDYSVNNIPDADSGMFGQSVTYEVTAGSHGPSDTKGAVFTFTVPVGVDIIDPENINFTTSCGNGTVVQAEALTYNEKSRTFTSKLDLPANCSITYTFNGTLSGVLGIKTAESTILRPNDVYDPDATNGDVDTPPTNPHYECFNNAGGGGSIGCNNIQEATFMLVDDCIDEYLYYEDFGRTTWAENSGRKDFVNQASISLNSTTGLPQYNTNGELIRDGQEGGATSTYLFAPGIGDNRYAAANISPHSSTVSVARIKSGYYSVNPPGYVQMGIPETDSWHEGLWVPNAPSNDPTLANSNYDWTPAWDHQDAIRDVSGAVNGAAFLVRGAASASQSIKPFYEFDVPGTIANGETYTLSMYSYVTYHDKDYMLMDVIDKNTGFIYASVPLTYPGLPDLPPGASPEGFSLGWVPLQASVKFDNAGCEIDIDGKEVKIAIRGSQDRSLETGKGFGHTLIDDISFTKRSASCDVPATDISCEDACYEDVEGEFYNWNYGVGEAPNNPVVETFTQPGTDGGFAVDIYYLDNSFNMNINGIDLYEDELEFQKGVANSPQNVRFKSDGAIWEDGTIQDIWKFYQNETITEQNKGSYTPVLRVIIDRFGNASLFGIREEYGVLEELEVFDSNGPRSLNTVYWSGDTTSTDVNEVIVSQNVVGVTAMTVYGYGQNQKECEFCDIIKDGSFDDNNEDGFAQAGETITYTFDVINAGDMAIHDIEVVDPLFGFNIKLDENSHEPIPDGVTFEGDINNNGVLDVNETWKFTVKYTVTSTDIFTNKGVHNQAKVTGVGKIGNSEFTVDEDSVPTEDNKQIEGRDPDLPNHTFVPLKGSGLLITNPMIYQRTK